MCFNIQMTKEEALAIQESQIKWYSRHDSNLREKVKAKTTADELEAGKLYPILVINKHIPRGSDIESLCGLSWNGYS